MMPSRWFERFGIGVRLSKASTLLCTLAATGPACSSDARPPSLVGVGGQLQDDGGVDAAAAESGSANTSGASGAQGGDSGAAGETVGAAGFSYELGGSSGKPPTEPAVCNRAPSWSEAESVGGVSSAASELLLALTPDELDLAFLRDGGLFVAHRSSVSAAFSEGTALTIPQGWSAVHGAALSADGKRLLLISEPGQNKLGEMTRPSRTSAFSGTVDTSAFTAINQDSTFTRRVYASPTVSAGDDQLLFNSALDAESTIVLSSRLGTGPWSTPTALNTGIFDGSEGKRRLPTGLSADGRTLFYFNEASTAQEARWRATERADSPLYDMLSLGVRRGAVVNSACNRLYSVTNGDVVVEKD